MIPSEHAERALDRLGDLDSFLHDASNALGRVKARARLGRAATLFPGRLSAKADDQARPEQLRTLWELALIRVVSIVERFVVDLGQHELDGRLARATIPADLTPLVRHLRDAGWESVTGTGSWVKPVGFWKDGLGVAVGSDFDRWSHLEFIRTTRNIIVHGLGAVEDDDKWFDKARSLKRLTALGIAEAKAEGRISVQRQDVEHGLAVARRFVLWLDSQRKTV